MTVATLLSWMICGLIVGMIARVLVPGRRSMSLLLTMVLGIVGAVVGGFLYSFVEAASPEPFSLSGNAWHGWIVAILGGALVLWVYVALHPRKWWQ
ncbi:MAG TPA: GlsB/YeaQ/YmgE family stress response membrane protein [Gemmataceae bacterium]|nr:GlsB/YeaQ/YmgE family stress response membrane protein [Gemmataceae bacterium]